MGTIEVGTAGGYTLAISAVQDCDVVHAPLLAVPLLPAAVLLAILFNWHGEEEWLDRNVSRSRGDAVSLW